MIKISKIKRKRRNPTPKLYKELDLLIGKNVIVYGQTDSGRFSFEGILEYSRIKNEYYIQSDILQKYTYQISFYRTAIKYIENNIIELNIQTTLDINNNSKILDRNIVNKNFVIEFNNEEIWFTVGGLIKFNNKDNIYYVQGDSFRVQLKFLIENVEKIKGEILFLNL